MDGSRMGECQGENRANCVRFDHRAEGFATVNTELLRPAITHKNQLSRIIVNKSPEFVGHGYIPVGVAKGISGIAGYRRNGDRTKKVKWRRIVQQFGDWYWLRSRIGELEPEWDPRLEVGLGRRE
ncbi:hypothetical protein E3N88_12980 [Mikania micrantha]|uniref:Uncharacterized protein n=1 Tax=Mikania micrantha TaxID=192012 RepID=A0A5N6P745_9ASTR|nr:hypothetical protein E3N88_12980 [Mikania micrantha]